ncbi:MAG: single-stranded-DNA-specific exonuclease RecJ [Phycisphaerales bacterium]|nr:single-stranded-DNA-specific exonuclease RecJ [Phycisphaerales bacterium]
MRGLTRRWVLTGPKDRDLRPPDGVDPLICRVLAARGLTDPGKIREFCTPRLLDLPEPATLPGADRAAARLVAAVRARERIVIYGDYDVDGITATAILYRTIRCVAPDADVRTYVPHRLEEGYGLNEDAIRQIVADGANVIVTVDCGITAHGPAAIAKAGGADLIITDHHNLPDDAAGLPDAYALVHPRLPGGAYPFGELAGAGVAFSLAWRFATTWTGSERVGDVLQKTLLDLLPLAALGTIADVVPLVGPNRVIAACGLRLIRDTSIIGLRALIEASDLVGEHIDAEHVGFRLGPRLNACGRMGHAGEAVTLFTTDDPAIAAPIAEMLAKMNRDRQQTERAIVAQADEMARNAGMTDPDRRVIVLAHDDWHPGVVGIVCSRLVDRYSRPTILLQRQGDVCKGSARSIDGYSIHAGLCACADHLQSFGGHDAAAGLSLATDRLPDFIAALTAHANAHIDGEQLTPSLHIDCDASLPELQMETVRRIGALSPFGRDNPRPTLRVCEVVVMEPPRQMGGHGAHLSLRLRQDGPNGRQGIRCVWWNAGKLASDLAAGMRLDAVIEPKLNTWNGRTTVEAEIRDVLVRT